MGACGCGDYSGMFRLAGPEGVTYVLEVYDGCEYCDTPAGVVINRFDREEAANWRADELPDFLDGFTYSSDPVLAQRLLPVVDGACVRSAFRLRRDDGKARSVLRGAIARTLHDWREENERLAARTRPASALIPNDTTTNDQETRP